MQQDPKTNQIRKFFLLILLLLTIYRANAERRALLVGIGAYAIERTGWKPIHGDADVRLLSPMLIHQGFSDVTCLVNEEATKKTIVQELASLAERCQAGDRVYFHFSGHGQPIEDANNDEQADFDESMIPYDAYKYPQNNYMGQNHLIDDEYNHLLHRIKQKIGSTGLLFVAIDACYSRGMERGEETEIEDQDILLSARGTDDPFTLNEESSTYLHNVPQPQNFETGGRLYVVSACLETERNFEYKTPSGKMYGSLSYYIYTLLKTDSNFERWAQCFREQDYRRYRIFQVSQHPSIQEYP